MLSPELTQGIQRLALAFVPVMFGIVCHEVAHGWAANKLGDPTAKNLGRLTLNPVSHLDPMGTSLFVLTALFSPVAFGYAKPVPVNPHNFHKPYRDMMLVSVAGPLANLAVAILCVFLFWLSTFVPQGVAQEFLLKSTLIGAQINVILMWLNLMPVPPLDGSKILMGFLPRDLAMQYARLEPYGMMILLGLLFFGVFQVILFPLTDMTVNILFAPLF